jgi:hypothetical protein
MAVFAERSMQSVINQVPLIVQNVFSGMEGFMNIAPLQLKGLASSQHALMLTQDNQTAQGSGSSTRAESTGVGTTSTALPHSALPNPEKASSFMPPKSVVLSKPMPMDVVDIARSTADSAAG